MVYRFHVNSCYRPCQCEGWACPCHYTSFCLQAESPPKVPALYWRWTLMPPIHPCKGLTLLTVQEESYVPFIPDNGPGIHIHPLEAAMDIGCSRIPLHLWTTWTSAATAIIATSEAGALGHCKCVSSAWPRAADYPLSPCISFLRLV